jgi:hypothetical protein
LVPDPCLDLSILIERSHLDLWVLDILLAKLPEHQTDAALGDETEHYEEDFRKVLYGLSVFTLMI